VTALRWNDDDPALLVSTARPSLTDVALPPEPQISTSTSTTAVTETVPTTLPAPPDTTATTTPRLTQPAPTTGPAVTPPAVVAAADRPGVYTAGRDGRHLRRLAPAGTAPVWSPDGRSVAYRDGTSLHVVDVASGSDRTVADGFANGHERPAWSPDSGLIAYPGPGDGAARDIWLVPADGSTAARPIRFAGDDSAVAWGPAGRLASMNEAGLWTFAADGSARSHVHTQNLSWGELEWSPDGSTLLGLPDSSGVDLLVGADGTKPRSLGGGQAAKSTATRGSFSPAGDQVVYEGSLNFKFGVIVTPTGGGVGRVVAESAAGSAWSPRGNVIVVVDAPENVQYRDLIILRPDGTERRTVLRVLPTLRLDPQVGWSPDGAQLAFSVAAYDGPSTPQPRPTYGKGVRCGEPAGTDGNGAQATSTAGAYAVTVRVLPCTGPPGSTVFIEGDVRHPNSYPTLLRFDYGDGTSYEYPLSYNPPSCANPGADPLSLSSPWHDYRASGRYTVTFTVRLVSCDPSGAATDVSASIPVYQE
jgi:Tol biopolymer transport system component